MMCKVHLYLLHLEHDGQADDRKYLCAYAVGFRMACSDVYDEKGHVGPRHVTYAQGIGQGQLSLFPADAAERLIVFQYTQTVLPGQFLRDDIAAGSRVEYQLAVLSVDAPVQGEKVPVARFVFSRVCIVLSVFIGRRYVPVGCSGRQSGV